MRPVVQYQEGCLTCKLYQSWIEQAEAEKMFGRLKKLRSQARMHVRKDHPQQAKTAAKN